MWHSLAAFVLPLISLLVGISALYIDPNSGAHKKWIMIGLLFASAVGAAAGSLSDDRTKDQTMTILTNQSQSIANLSGKADSLSGKTDTILDVLKNHGFSPEATAVIGQSISADAARTKILSSVLNSGSDANITVAYYPKDVDGPVVINALKEGGFKVESRPGNSANAKLATNAIWIGDDVTVGQAKFVALTLTRAGVGIAVISRGFRNDSPRKKDWIEVGTDQSFVGSPSLTVEKISSLTEIPPNKSPKVEVGN
jgi:hypothetical protein